MVFNLEESVKKDDMFFFLQSALMNYINFYRVEQKNGF